MKVLLHITKQNEYIVGDERTGKLYKYTNKELTTGQRFHIKYLHVNKKSVSVDSKYEELLKSNAISVLCSLAEGKKVIGYLVYIPVEEKLSALTGDNAAELANNYGLVSGNIKVTPSNAKRYIEGKFSVQPAFYHKQIYMNLYRERKEKLELSNKCGEKIVRPSIDVIEMRYIPAYNFDIYSEPKGVNVFNFRWWKIVDNEFKILKRPTVKHLDISNYCEYIKYFAPTEKYIDILNESDISLGAFAHWKLDTVELGNKLKEIGKEAFYSNNLTEIKIKRNVNHIDDRAFMNNMIERLFFCKGENLVLGEYAFANNNLQELSIPSNIISIETGCFSGNTSLNKIKFDSNSKITILKDFVFKDCAIESIQLPVSIETVEDNTFDGCDLLKEIYIKSSSKLNTNEFKQKMKEKGIEVLLN